jgi:hypothetical protein
VAVPVAPSQSAVAMPVAARPAIPVLAGVGAPASAQSSAAGQPMPHAPTMAQARPIAPAHRVAHAGPALGGQGAGAPTSPWVRRRNPLSATSSHGLLARGVHADVER